MDAKEILVSAIKEAEDKGGVVIRAYEAMHRQTPCHIEAAFMDRSIDTVFAPSEIKTFYLPYDREQAVREVNLIEL